MGVLQLTVGRVAAQKVKDGRWKMIGRRFPETARTLLSLTDVPFPHRSSRSQKSPLEEKVRGWTWEARDNMHRRIFDADRRKLQRLSALSEYQKPPTALTNVRFVLDMHLFASTVTLASSLVEKEAEVRRSKCLQSFALSPSAANT